MINIMIDAMPNANRRAKELSKLLFYFCLLIVALIVTGKAVGQEFRMEGTWRVNVEKTLLASMDANKAKYDSLSELKVQNFKKSLEGRQYIFNVDRTIQISITQNNETKTSTGTWSYDDDSRTLIVALAKSEHVFLIQKRNLNDITLVRDNRQTRSLLVDIVLVR